MTESSEEDKSKKVMNMKPKSRTQKEILEDLHQLVHQIDNEERLRYKRKKSKE